MFGVAMTLSDRGGEERIRRLDSSHFRLPLQYNLFLSLIQSGEIQAGHLTGARYASPYLSVCPLIQISLDFICWFPDVQRPLVGKALLLLSLMENTIASEAVLFLFNQTRKNIHSFILQTQTHADSYHRESHFGTWSQISPAQQGFL